MRGDDEQQQAGMFSYIALEDRIPKNHPLRGIRQLVDEVLKNLSLEFDRLYAKVGRPSIPPERLLRALLLQAFYSIRSERLLMEQLEYNLLFRWFVGLEIDEAVGNHAVFSKHQLRPQIKAHLLPVLCPMHRALLRFGFQRNVRFKWLGGPRAQAGTL